MKGKFIEIAILEPINAFIREVFMITNTHNIAWKSQKFNSAATVLDMKPVQSTSLIMACKSLHSELKQFML